MKSFSLDESTQQVYVGRNPNNINQPNMTTSASGGNSGPGFNVGLHNSSPPHNPYHHQQPQMHQPMCQQMHHHFHSSVSAASSHAVHGNNKTPLNCQFR
jgi:hypothetical protein